MAKKPKMVPHWELEGEFEEGKEPQPLFQIHGTCAKGHSFTENIYELVQTAGEEGKYKKKHYGCKQCKAEADKAAKKSKFHVVPKPVSNEEN